MAARIPALVEPSLLVWARERASLSQIDAAAKIGVALDKLEAWELGKASLSIPQLKKLAEVYKRPISVFFLPEPPADFQALRDFRRLQEFSGQPLSRALAYEIRAAHERRLIAIELADELGDPPAELGVVAKRTDDPETIATKLRDRLGISLQQQSRWGNPQSSFRGWRDALEEAGALVSVLGGAHHQVPMSEVRGFAIAERPFPMIVVNGQDRGYGQIFTLMHELGHIVLGESIFEDDLEPHARMPAANRATETFCNRLAAAVLMPKEALLAENLVVAKIPNTVWTDVEVTALSKRYGVSREALIVRLAELGRVSNDFVQTKRAEYAAQYAALAKKEDQDDLSGFAPYHYQILSHIGRGYARLVLQAYNGRYVTLSTASGYLGTQAKLVPKIEHAAYTGAAAN